MNIYFSRIWHKNPKRFIAIHSPQIFIDFNKYKLEINFSFSNHFSFHQIWDVLKWKEGKEPTYQGWHLSIVILGFGLEIIWGK